MDEHLSPTWEDFAAGWELGIYGDPVFCGVVAGLGLGYLGVFVVLRRMVFVTAAVSQAAGLGVALTFYVDIHFAMDIDPALGAVALALAVTAVFAVPPDRLRLSREGILGLVYIACWAGAVLVGDRIAQEAHEISAILFGSAVLVRPEDLMLVTVVGGGVLLVYVAGHRGLVFAAFDRESARVQGLPVRALDLLSWILVALAVSVTTRALGVLPVFAFAVLPAMAALMLSNRLRWVLPIAAVLGAVAGGAGYLFAFFLELPVGASQAIVAFLLFLACSPARLVRGP
jgi:zinc transport system permease protein